VKKSKFTGEPFGVSNGWAEMVKKV
jgi:hypothetical protein